LVLQCLQLLENIFLSSEEYGGLAWQLGAEADLNTIFEHKVYSEDFEIQDAVRSARLQLDMSSRRKKLSVAERAEAEAKRALVVKKQAAQKRMADRKKKVAEVGRAQQAKMLKMMSLRPSMKSSSSDATMADQGTPTKSTLRSFLSGKGRKRSKDLKAQSAEVSIFSGSNPYDKPQGEQNAPALSGRKGSKRGWRLFGGSTGRKGSK